MNRFCKINTQLALWPSALVTLLALSAPAYAGKPGDELEVTMDVIDDGDPAPTTGKELVVREDHDADKGGRDSAERETAEHEDADDDSHADHDQMDDKDEPGEQEEADDGDVNDDGTGERESEQPDDDDRA